MALVASPYGLRPVNQGDNSFTQAIPIASGYAANIFTGDIVQIVAAGTIERVGAASTAIGLIGNLFPTGTIGVFMGCQYTDATRGLVHSQYWPTGTVAADAVAFVVTDPTVTFKIQAEAAVTQAVLGINSGVIPGASLGSTVTGVSTVALDTSAVAVTATIGLRIVGFQLMPGYTFTTDLFPDVLVRFNSGTGGHALLNPVGI